MSDVRIFDNIGRKAIVTGHYGSGKTEFAVSLALLVSKTCQENRPSDKVSRISLIDLDIVNPYFRSQEKRGLLESSGISVYSNIYKNEITAELPAIDASIRTPLESKTCRVIIDTGGNDTGALVLNQFSKYFTDDTTVLAIVNANRPETSNIEGILEHIAAIEDITNLTVAFIVNNTHMLRETKAADIIYGHDLCKKVSELTGKHILCNCYPEGIVNPNELKELTGQNENLMPLGLYLRPTWLDK